MRKFLASLLFLVFLASPSFAFAAIAVDNVGAYANFGSTSSVTLGGSNGLVFIRVTRGTGATVSGIDVGGVAATLLVSTTGWNQGTEDLWYAKMGSASGAQTVTVSNTGGGNFTPIAYTGVDQSSPIDQSGTGVTNGATSQAITLTPTSANQWMFFAYDTNGGSAITGQTNLVLRSDTVNPCVALNGCRVGDSNGTITNGVGNTQTVSSALNNEWAAVAATFKEATAVPAPPANGIIMVMGEW